MNDTIDKKHRQKEYFKKWYSIRIKEEKKRVTCECGTNISYMNLCNHKKNLKHARLMEKLNKEIV